MVLYVAFMGDTMTFKWAEQGLETWNHLYAPINAGNLAAINDSTLMLIEKLEREEIPLENTRTIVLQIGGTDLRHRIRVRIVYEQIQKIVLLLQQNSPGVKIIILGIIPRGCDSREVLASIQETNEKLSDLENGFTKRFHDMWTSFFDKEKGKIVEDLYDKDGVNLSAKGYQVWGNQMATVFEECLQ